MGLGNKIPSKCIGGETHENEFSSDMADLALEQDPKMHRGFLSDDENLALTVFEDSR